MGKALYNEISVSFQAVTDQPYPQLLEVDVKSMRKKSLQLLSVVAVCGVLLILISFVDLSSSSGSSDYLNTFSRYCGIGALVVTVGYVYFVFVNSGRAVNRIVMYPTGFYINNDQFYNDGTLKVTIKPFMPIAGLADNVYLTVSSQYGTKKYWFGVKGDQSAETARTAVRSALSQLYPPISL